MLAKKYRFHNSDDVVRVYKYGQGRRNDIFGIRSLTRTTATGNSIDVEQVDDKVAGQICNLNARIAVVINKRVAKSAVVRNRCRRRVYALIRELINISEPNDIVVTIFSANVVTMEFDKLKRKLQSILH